MSDAPGDDGQAEIPVWTNDFPQIRSRIAGLHPILLIVAVFLFALALLGDRASFTATNGLAGLGVLLLAASATQKYFEHRRPNSVRAGREGGCVIHTRPVHDTLILVALTCVVFASAAFVVGYWRPYSDFPHYNARDFTKETIFLYLSPGLAAIGLVILAFRPWRRQLIFSSDGLSYRRFVTSVFIPWDTIDDVTPYNDRHMHAVVIAARPPARLPALERKRLPNGSTRAKLAIYGMTVDPATIVYLIRRFAADPDARKLLATSQHPEHLFTGPSWQERIAMAPGQTWALDTTETRH